MKRLCALVLAFTAGTGSTAIIIRESTDATETTKPTTPVAGHVAMVVGENAYPAFPQHEQLTSPKADAQDVAAELRKIGFEVMAPVLDGTREAIMKTKATFMEKAKGAKLAVFYFSGHGYQVGNENYLIPCDMPKITSFTVLKENSIPLRESIMAGMEEAQVGTKIVILDCCRNNPFAKQIDNALSTKSLRTKGGSGEISGYGQGFFLAFATSPGDVADDGNGNRNSPFTSALLTHLKDKASLNIRDLFDEVKSTVSKNYGVDQVPWVNDSLNKDNLKVLAMTGSGVRPAAVEMPKPILPTIPASPPVNPTTNPLDNGAIGQIYELKLPGNETMKFCYCPPGTFTMGSPVGEVDRFENEDQVQVKISKGYWLAHTECTQGQWQTVTAGNPSHFKGSVRLPVETVSYEEVQGWLSQVGSKVQLPAGWKLVLPTEAQWEYACRAGTQTPFSFGITLNGADANCDGSHPYGTKTKGAYLEKTSVVGSYVGNAWGLQDMHGNVYEWCADWYGEKLGGGTDPGGPQTGADRVSRGGSWRNIAASCRAANRNNNFPGRRIIHLGFRPALVPSK